MSYGFGFFGLIFLALGAVILRNDLRRWRNAVFATGVVEEKIFKPGRSTPAGVVVAYTSQDGATRQVSLALPAEHAPVAVGDPFEIVYDPTDLRQVSRAAAHDPGSRPRFNALIVLGVLFLAGSAVFLAIGI
ncbi:DUF3592 domain-containing protein [Streptomyces europaeiscabiei]|uniref:DUF3592 domain-containing protein n=1 Tax=Streptomyces europaeiscabiei TaxID=146819 RepID=UPI0029B70CC7|nr:DUF3592 domain-containing protein [Streptomyces europaeiscabiei]MDX3839973.1 hypothetical protein [Streptomyces europaeiscabiei]